MSPLAFLLWMALILPAQTDSPAGRISGRVVVSGSTTPIAGAQVVLMPIFSGPPAGRMIPPGQPSSQLTDADGRFSFDGVVPGRYRVNVQKAGFAADLPMSGTTPRPPVAVAAGQLLDMGDIALDRGGAIAGRVLDPSGEPLADVRVMALRRLPRGRGAPALPPTSPPLMPVGQPNQTNDLGEFRIFGLPPGEYFVSAVPQPRFGAPPTNAPSVLTTTYFPGTTDADAAMPVTVTAAQSTNGIELRVVSVQAYRVSGIVVDESGSPVAGAVVMLMPDGRFAMFGGFSGNVRSGDNGRFAVGGVASGTYRATASVPIMNRSGGGIIGGIVGGGPGVGTEIVVTDANVSGVRVVIQGR
jgi:carboxypeptidase family protein